MRRRLRHLLASGVAPVAILAPATMSAARISPLPGLISGSGQTNARFWAQRLLGPRSSTATRSARPTTVDLGVVAVDRR